VLEDCAKIMADPTQKKNKKKVGNFSLIYNSEEQKNS
jgi:hypothetical protein